METEIKFRSIAHQWIFKVLLLVVAFVVVVEIVLCSFVRALYIERVRSRANEYAEDFSVLSMVSAENFYSVSREYTEDFAHKDKIDIEIIDSYGNLFISTKGFITNYEKMPDYEAAKNNTDGSATVETISSTGEAILCGTNILPDYGNGSNGAVRWRISLEGVNRHIRVLQLVMIGVGILVIGFTCLLGQYFMKSIVKPIKTVSLAARKIATGDYATEIELHKNDEIGELCDAINYMSAELRQTENMKNDFISSVSHELRTPLTAIRGWGETAMMSVGTDEEIVKKGLDVVLSEAERLSSLVEELLDFSRMQSGRLSLNSTCINVSDVMQEVAQMYTELANQQEISLSFVAPKYDSVIEGDKNRLKQVFINIVDNAVKYTEAGGQVLITQNEEEGCVRVTVKDTGVGIPAQDIDRVKEKFFKSNKTVRGSGIGLAVADEIIKQHGGLLFLESSEGVGTTVTIALPLYEPPIEEPEQTTLEPLAKDGENNG